MYALMDATTLKVDTSVFARMVISCPMMASTALVRFIKGHIYCDVYVCGCVYSML